MAVCFNCGYDLSQIEIHRSSECPECGKDAKVCLNCEFYSPGSHWDCRETIPEAVREKDRANFCGYFKLSVSKFSPSGKPKKGDSDRKAFDSLFGE